MERQQSLDSGGGSPSSSGHARSSSALTALLRKPQNMQAMAAAQRLAQVMAVHEDEDDDDDNDDLAIHHTPTGLGLSAGRAHRPRPRPSIAAMSISSLQPCISTEQALPRQATRRRTASLSMSFTQPKSPPEKSPKAVYPIVQQPSFGPSTSVKRPHVVARLGTLVPPPTTALVKQPSARNSGATPVFRRLSMELGNVDFQESADIESRDSSALQDEVDMLQEDNDSLLEKLRLAQKRCEEAEARAKQLENQVAGLGEGISLEARLLSRKEAALQKLEWRTKDGDATSALEQLQETESELRSLRSAVQRLVLTQEEKEEVVLKRCWLARYWGLCVKYGIHPDIAGAKHEYWSSWAPLPFEVVVAAGMDAKQDCESAGNCDMDERESMVRDVNRVYAGDSDAESMILVEKGLRELASLKVEDAVLFEMAQKRKRNVQRVAFSDETACPSAQHKLLDAFEVSPEEAEDMQFKMAWLIYLWRRAKRHGLEEDIAEERLETWIEQSTQLGSSHVAVDVERGMMELRKLGIETGLWEESRSRSWME